MIRKKIASMYLQSQYEKAKKHLEKEVNSGADIKELSMVCDRVRRAGIAYAQTLYCVFSKDGTYIERTRSEIKEDCIIICSFYNEFIKQMESYIRWTIGQKQPNKE